LSKAGKEAGERGGLLATRPSPDKTSHCLGSSTSKGPGQRASRWGYSDCNFRQTTISMVGDGAAPVLSMGSTAEFLSKGGASQLPLGLIQPSKTPQWRVLLPEARPFQDAGEPPDCVAAWADAADAAAAKAVAARHGIPCLLLQNGVLRAPPFA